MSCRRSQFLLIAGLIAITSQTTFSIAQQATQIIIPGSGTQLTQVGDDFEDPSWAFIPNGAKSSEEIDKQERLPLGKSNNGRWYEGAKRGYPDVCKRVPTPPGGLIGSTGSMLLQTKYTGVPGRISNEVQQDDFICNVQYRVGGALSVSQCPSFTTRVYMPPLEEWENRSGPHFAFRSAIETTKMEKGKFLFSGSHEENEVYWPGLFVLMDFRKNEAGQNERYAYFRVRADRNGGDFRGPDIAVTGWWTLGLSFSSDGIVHYFAHPGVQDLTREDYIASTMPYGYRCERIRTFFYNSINREDGRTWSTPFIVDDPKVFVLYMGRTASR